MPRFIVTKKILAGSIQEALQKESGFTPDSVYMDESYGGEDGQKEIQGFGLKKKSNKK